MFCNISLERRAILRVQKQYSSGKKTIVHDCFAGITLLAGKFKLGSIVDVWLVCHAQGAAYVLQHLPGTAGNPTRSKTVLVGQKDYCS
jgi:hypothetical protein